MSHSIQFLKCAGLPRAQVRCVVASAREPKITHALQTRGIEVLHPCACSELLVPEQHHADLLLRHVGGEEIFLAPGQTKLAHSLRQYGGRPMVIDRPLCAEYPRNVGLNALLCGNVLFARLDSAAPELIEMARHRGWRTHPVRQGYAGCAAALVGESAIMTADRGIAHAAGQEGIDCLLLTPGHIRCDGFDTGLIGGCCGKISPDILAFSGDPGYHPDAQRMKQFCRQYGVEMLALTEGELCDIGGIVPILEEDR